ncbi:MAG: aminotransferase class V-fold PLP-dependent enzyme [Planctomycetota bacterium]
MKFHYFDNAATSWPKPETVIQAMEFYFRQVGGNPGRSGHRKAIEAGRIVLKTRDLLAALFNVKDPARIVFTKNATEALNIALYGVLKAGDHAVTSSMEHNSVMRPLNDLSRKGLDLSVAEANRTGAVTADMIRKCLNEKTRLVAVTHASNVTGTINEIEKIGLLCKQNNILFLVDAAQTAGVVPLDVEKMSIDLLAFSGHKGLLGPQGTGGLFIRDEKFLKPLTRGGTGSLSDSEEQPEFLPDCFESGTLNVIGLAGLGEGIRFIFDRGIDRIMAHERRLLEIFLNETDSDGRFVLYGTGNALKQTGVLSLNIRGFDASKVGEVLDRKYGILTRIGLHCAPRAHRTLGTFPDGTVRFSWGFFTGEKDILKAVRYLKEIAKNKKYHS